MKKEHISDFELEQYLLDELPEARKKEIARSIRQSSVLSARLKDLEQSNEAILREYPVARVSAHIAQRNNAQRKRERKTRIFSLYVVPAFTLASLMIVTVFWMTSHYYVSDTIMAPTRIKGDAVSLYVYRKKDHRVELLSNNARAQANDLLRIGYYSEKERYGIIFSIDGKKSLTLHFPDRADASTRLRSHQKVLLPNAYELDNAPLFEKFIMVTSEEKLDAGVLMKKLELHRDYLPDNIESLIMIDKSLCITSLTVLKTGN